MRRTLSVRLSVRPSVPLSLPSVTSRHLANYNDTCTSRHALRAAYRTAISAAQILVFYYYVASMLTEKVSSTVVTAAITNGDLYFYSVYLLPDSDEVIAQLPMAG